MIDLLHALLTDVAVRDNEAITARIIDQQSAGTPWLDSSEG